MKKKKVEYGWAVVSIDKRDCDKILYLYKDRRFFLDERKLAENACNEIINHYCNCKIEKVKIIRGGK